MCLAGIFAYFFVAFFLLFCCLSTFSFFLSFVNVQETLCNPNLHGATIIVRIMEVFELWGFNSIISASKGQRIKIELRRVRIIEVQIIEILLYIIRTVIYSRISIIRTSIIQTLLSSIFILK